MSEDSFKNIDCKNFLLNLLNAITDSSEKDANTLRGEFKEENLDYIRLKQKGLEFGKRLNQMQIETWNQKEIIETDLLSDKVNYPDTTSLSNLNLEIKHWLMALGYKLIDSKTVDHRTTEMRFLVKKGAFRQSLLVRCIADTVFKKDLNLVVEQLSLDFPQGWLISNIPVASSLKEAASNLKNLQLFSLHDFLKEKIWGKYIYQINQTVREKKIPKYFVDLTCTHLKLDQRGTIKSKKEFNSLNRLINDWLKLSGKEHISLLGEFGTGKTWFCIYYAFKQLQRFLEDPYNERFPLLITLRRFTKSLTAKQLINDALIEDYGLPILGNAFDFIQVINKKGKLLLILDGFDEMAQQVDYQTVVDNFWELANLVTPNSKVILTSRVEYFRLAVETEKILGGNELGRNNLELKSSEFEVFHINPFKDFQIRNIIYKHLGPIEAPKAIDSIVKNENLKDMAKRPVLIELLLSIIDEVDVNTLEHQGQIFLHATNKLLLRNIQTKRTFTSTKEKLFFLSELAWEMIQNRKLRIHYKEIPQRIKTYFGERIKHQHELDNWDYDLRNQTLLHRDTAGYYEFAHKSLAEYFVAFKFASEIDCLAPMFVNTYFSNIVNSNDLLYNANNVDLTQSFGLLQLSDERLEIVLQLLPGMLAKNVEEKFLSIIDKTKSSQGDVGYVGGNAITYLHQKGFSFVGAKLEDTNLNGADLQGCDLTRANLARCSLAKVNLKEAILSNANLQYTKMWNANLQEAYLEDTNFDGADLQNVDVNKAKVFNTTLFPKHVDINKILQNADKIDFFFKGEPPVG